MVRARPVVSTDVVAIPEMVDEEVGWLVPPNDAGALAGALETALADGDERAARGAEARRRALSRFLERDQVEVLIAIYERVLAARTRRS
jgi:glycosyltransferase involved in cell wall biosynthesis